MVWLDWNPANATGSDVAAKLLVALQQNPTPRLDGGHDGRCLPRTARATASAASEADPTMSS